MRILVTGARGKLGAATLDTLLRAGHEVTAVDRMPPVYERAGQVRYIQADLTDAGHAAAVLPGHDAVVHAAGIPSPVKNPPHEILQTKPDGDLFHAGGRRTVRRTALRTHLQRDRAGLSRTRSGTSTPSTRPSTSCTPWRR